MGFNSGFKGLNQLVDVQKVYCELFCTNQTELLVSSPVSSTNIPVRKGVRGRTRRQWQRGISCVHLFLEIEAKHLQQIDV